MFLFFISLTSLSDMRLYEFIFCSVFYVRLRRIREILLRTITILFTKCSKLEEFKAQDITDQKAVQVYDNSIYQKKWIYKKSML